MSDFIGDRQCVTHHHACDCREVMFKDLQVKLDFAIEALEKINKTDCSSNNRRWCCQFGQWALEALQKTKDSEAMGE